MKHISPTSPLHLPVEQARLLRVSCGFRPHTRVLTSYFTHPSRWGLTSLRMRRGSSLARRAPHATWRLRWLALGPTARARRSTLLLLMHTAPAP